MNMSPPVLCSVSLSHLAHDGTEPRWVTLEMTGTANDTISTAPDNPGAGGDNMSTAGPERRSRPCWS
jgi:hypothetical protein